MNYEITVLLKKTFDEVIRCTLAALEEEGFGVLTEIDVQAAIKDKLGVYRAPYLILGACNPTLAHQAIEADPNIGLLLPCNVVIQEDQNGQISVSFIDPQSVLGLVEHQKIQTIATELRAKLLRVSKAISSPTLHA